MASSRPSAKARRSAARLAAVQALYQIDQTGAEPATVIGEFVRHRFGMDVDGAAMVTPDPTLFEEIVRGTCERLDAVTDLVEGALDKSWTVARLESILRAILRAGAWELLARRDTPAPVVIAEYVHVANAFFGGREPAMVNAVLDRIARLQRGGEVPGAAAEG